MSKLNPAWVRWFLLAAIAAAAAYLGLKVPPLPPPPDEPILAFGWVDDPAAREPVAARCPEFGTTPAGKAALGPENAYLWKAVEKCWAGYPGKDSRGYPNEDQRDVGCCVGMAQKHVLDTLSAVEIVTGSAAEEWKPTAVEFVYAAGRVDIGNGQIRGDGSIGAWSAAAAEKVGTCPMAKVTPDVDLTRFDPYRARSWGQAGIPKPVREPFAGKHTCTAARVRSWADAQQAVLQGYPVMLCSEQAFVRTRDADGFAAPNPGDRWPHAMALLGVRADRPGGFILNSWGDRFHTGPRGPGDPPAAGFWASADVIDRMCRSGDCWAFSQFAGFPARKIDWYAVKTIEPGFVGRVESSRPDIALHVGPRRLGPTYQNGRLP